MRRVLIAIAVIAVAAAAAIVHARGGTDEEYRVAVIFDTAKGMVAGQQVKVAGAPAGSVEEIELAPGPKARMLLRVERRYAPFRADARCTLLPEGLISENYVECDPGARGAELPRDRDGIPTVPVRRTTAPVSLQDVLNVFSLPTAERLRILISELGIGTSGRGQDLNALLRRANPALTAAKDALSIFAEQRREIGAAIGDTDEVLARIGQQRGQLRAFVGRAAETARTTSARSGPLGESIRRLPAMLDAVRPGLRSLDRAATDATPLVRSLRRSAPEVGRLTRTLPALTVPANQALRGLSTVTRDGRPVLRRARPTVARLGRVMDQLGPLTPEIDRLLVSLRETGGIEGTMRLLYTLAALTGSYDGTSHFVSFVANVAPNCLAAQAAEREEKGCNQKWSSPGKGAIPINQPACGPQRPEHLWRNHYCAIPLPAGTPLRRAQARRTARERERRPSAQQPPAPATATPAKPTPPVDVPALLDRILDKVGGQPQRPSDDVTALLDFLLK